MSPEDSTRILPILRSRVFYTRVFPANFAVCPATTSSICFVRAGFENNKHVVQKRELDLAILQLVFDF